MKVFLASAGVPERFSAIPQFETQLASQRERRHQQVGDPALADVVLFTDCHIFPASHWTLPMIRTSTLAREFADKTCVYNERDRPWCCLPGVYVSMPASGFVPRWQVAGGYIRLDLAEALAGQGSTVEPDLLFSFIGAATHPCRRNVFKLRVPRSVVMPSDAFTPVGAPAQTERSRARYAEVLLRSKFVLCPRGHGTSTFRLYETMAAGRVPVIISDSWVPPYGPAWEDFSIRWPQAGIPRLPAHLIAREHEAVAMGARARAAYQQWFARDVVLTHQLDQLGRLLGVDGFAAFPKAGCRNLQYYRTLRGASVARIADIGRRVLGRRD